jgi:uncharacterized protein YgiM (DUF1202 family)
MSLRFLGVFAALFVAMIFPASAQVSQATTTTVNLNMRAGPGTHYAIIRTIPRGTIVHVFSCVNGVTWCQLVFNGRRGFVSANHLSPRPTVTAQTPGQPFPLRPPPPPFPQPTVPGGIVVTGFLTNEGLECPALRGEDGRLYTLVGNLGMFRPGDRVRVRGPIPQSSICMQGVTIRVSSIERAF